MNVLLTMSSVLFPLITFPYVSRVLLPEGTGKVAFATSVISYFVLFAQLGIPTYGIRACAKVREDRKELSKVSHELLLINMLFSLFSYVVLAAALVAVPKLREEAWLYIVISPTILLGTIGMEWLFKAMEQYTYITVRSLLAKLIALVALFIFIHDPKDYIIYGAISVFSAAASNVCNLFRARKYIDFKPIGNYNFKRHLKPILIIFAMSCAATIYTNMDVTLLGFLTTDTQVGYYNSAIKIKTLLVSVVTALGAVLLPRSSFYIEKGDMRSFRELTQKALSFVFVIGIPLVTYFILFAEQAIVFLSGNLFLPAVLPMQIMMPTVLLIGITNVVGMQMLIPLGKEKLVLYSTLLGAAVDLCVNFIAIPLFGTSGAALACLLAETSVLICQVVMSAKISSGMFSEVSIFKIMAGTVIGVACSLWVVTLESGLFLTLALSALLFFCAYGLMLILLKEKMVIKVLGQIKAMVVRRLRK